nr:hypothetical protein Iba_chr02fCG6390 [Ipomoea batatas]
MQTCSTPMGTRIETKPMVNGTPVDDPTSNLFGDQKASHGLRSSLCRQSPRALASAVCESSMAPYLLMTYRSLHPGSNPVFAQQGSDVPTLQV